MFRRTSAIAAALSLLALGYPLLTGCTNAWVKQYFDQAVEKFEEGNYQGAIADLTTVIEMDPQDAVSYYNRGLAKSHIEDLQGAIADYNKAIEINPQYAEAFNNRGNIKTQLKDYQGAIADYSKAVEIDPQDDTTYYNRGNVKGELEDYQGAIADYNKALEIDPQGASLMQTVVLPKNLGMIFRVRVMIGEKQEILAMNALLNG